MAAGPSGIDVDQMYEQFTQWIQEEGSDAHPVGMDVGQLDTHLDLDRGRKWGSHYEKLGVPVATSKFSGVKILILGAFDKTKPKPSIGRQKENSFAVFFLGKKELQMIGNGLHSESVMEQKIQGRTITQDQLVLFANKINQPYKFVTVTQYLPIDAKIGGITLRFRDMGATIDFTTTTGASPYSYWLPEEFDKEAPKPAEGASDVPLHRRYAVMLVNLTAAILAKVGKELAKDARLFEDGFAPSTDEFWETVGIVLSMEESNLAKKQLGNPLEKDLFQAPFLGRFFTNTDDVTDIEFDNTFFKVVGSLLTLTLRAYGHNPKIESAFSNTARQLMDSSNSDEGAKQFLAAVGVSAGIDTESRVQQFAMYCSQQILLHNLEKTLYHFSDQVPYFNQKYMKKFVPAAPVLETPVVFDDRALDELKRRREELKQQKRKRSADAKGAPPAKKPRTDKSPSPFETESNAASFGATAMLFSKGITNPSPALVHAMATTLAAAQCGTFDLRRAPLTSESAYNSVLQRVLPSKGALQTKAGVGAAAQHTRGVLARIPAAQSPAGQNLSAFGTMSKEVAHSLLYAAHLSTDSKGALASSCHCDSYEGHTAFELMHKSVSTRSERVADNLPATNDFATKIFELATNIVHAANLHNMEEDMDVGSASGGRCGSGSGSGQNNNSLTTNDLKWASKVEDICRGVSNTTLSSAGRKAQGNKKPLYLRLIRRMRRYGLLVKPDYVDECAKKSLNISSLVREGYIAPSVIPQKCVSEACMSSSDSRDAEFPGVEFSTDCSSSSECDDSCEASAPRKAERQRLNDLIKEFTSSEAFQRSSWLPAGSLTSAFNLKNSGNRSAQEIASMIIHEQAGGKLIKGRLCPTEGTGSGIPRLLRTVAKQSLPSMVYEDMCSREGATGASDEAARMSKYTSTALSVICNELLVENTFIDVGTEACYRNSRCMLTGEEGSCVRLTITSVKAKLSPAGQPYLKTVGPHHVVVASRLCAFLLSLYGLRVYLMAKLTKNMIIGQVCRRRLKRETALYAAVVASALGLSDV